MLVVAALLGLAALLLGVSVRLRVIAEEMAAADRYEPSSISRTRGFSIGCRWAATGLVMLAVLVAVWVIAT